LARLYGHTRSRATHGVEGSVVGVVGTGCRADAAAFGRGPTNRIGGIESGPSLAHQSRWRGRTTGDEQFHRTQVATVEVGILKEKGDLGGDGADGGDPGPGDEIQDVAGPPAVEEVGGGTESQVPGQLGGEAHMGELGRPELRERIDPHRSPMS